ncbi:hypothetical protein ACFV5N_12475 [Streptomyces sp. NPDC059853]|uniref:hypothetical protein n=1 Tax=Streptomyces sp. NPDC059853 TaxID=3346973 RepID=UPI003649633B
MAVPETVGNMRRKEAAMTEIKNWTNNSYRTILVVNDEYPGDSFKITPRKTVQPRTTIPWQGSKKYLYIATGNSTFRYQEQENLIFGGPDNAKDELVAKCYPVMTVTVSEDGTVTWAQQE